MTDEQPTPNETRRPGWGRVLLVVIAVMALLAMIVAVARMLPVTRRYYTDAESIREPIGAARVRDILWQPPRPLSEIINTERDDYEPRLSADGLTLFFVRGKAGGNADIFVSTRKYEGWTTPRPLDELNSEYDDLGPEPSPEGDSLYFYSDRTGGRGGFDLWVAHRINDTWQPAINLGPAVNSEYNDYGPALTPDGTTLYFASNRPRPDDERTPDPRAWPATIREDFFHRDYDLYTAAISEAGVGEARALTLLNTPHNEGAPAVSSFGDFLYFASDRPGGFGGFDLHRAWRVKGVLREAENLGPALNTPANEMDPGLSLGGYALYFSSDRSAENPHVTHVDDLASDAAVDAGRDTANVDEGRQREYNLYYTTSREVFADVERLERAAVDWAAVWGAIWPHLLWALLAALILLALLWLLRDARGRRLSLLAKCLLASLMAHLLLMLLFNVWEVTASLAREFHRRGRIQIALASPSTGLSLAEQIRGSLTDVDAPDAEPLPIERSDFAPPAAPPVERVTLDAEPIAVDVQVSQLLETDTRESHVTHEMEAPPPKEPELSAQSPDLADMATPMEPTRVAEVEPTRHPPVETRETTIERPDVVADPLKPRDPAAELMPAALNADQLGDKGRSLAEVIASRDAQRPVASEQSAAATPPDANALVPVETVLPPVPAERPTAVDEPTPRVSGDIRDARLDASPADEPVDANSTLAFLAPQIREMPKTPGTFVDAAARAIREAHPEDEQIAPITRPATTSLAESRWESLQLAVPEAPVMPAMTSDQSPPRQTSAAVTETRAALEARPVDLPADAAVVDIPPSSALRNDENETFVTSNADQFADVPPRDAQVEIRAEALHVEAALPPLTQLAVPQMPASNGTVVPEPPARVDIKIAGVPPRASVVASDAAALDMPFTEIERTQLAMADIPAGLPGHVDAPIRDATPRAAEPMPDLQSMSVPDLAPSDLSLFDLALPKEQQAPENPYVQRNAPDRLDIVKRMGGSEQTENAVANALRWLAAHQSDDGRWDGDGFDARCGQCGGTTDIVVDNALTGLALLCFYGAGHTHETDGPYRDVVRRGLTWLLAQQQPDGDLRGEETMYSHGIATIALSEAYGMTRDSALPTAVARAVHFIDRARNRSVGGWRYDPGQAGDTSVLGWQVMAMKSAAMNGVAVPTGAFRAARDWMERVSHPSRPGLYAYQPGKRPTPSMTAEGMFVQQLLGVPREDPRMLASADYVSDHPPDWEEESNTYYWYYATLALFHHGGPRWSSWNATLTGELLKHQRKDMPAAGSWDPTGEWANIGGRVYQTALCTLMLEVYYRYLPLYANDAAIDPIGAIRGYVTNASTGDPLSGAVVRLDLPDREPLTVTTGVDGAYVLLSPEVPDHFALSTSRPGFVPVTANVASAQIKGTTLALDFELTPQSLATVAIEAVPEVHHLGDDKFEGRINSQFQKQSEGSEFAVTFVLLPEQAPPVVTHAEVRLLAKGVQRRHTLRVNGTPLDDRLDDAPSDGSFGEFVAEFDPDLLRVGSNRFELIAQPSDTDIDDFEFVNVRVYVR